VYVLDLRVPKQDAKRITVQGDLSIGSDSSCDIQIKEFGLAPLQGRFHLQNEVLTLTNLGPDNSLKIGSTKCGHGRMYILDKGDKCTIDKVKFIVRKDKVEKQEIATERPSENTQTQELNTSDDTQPDVSEFDESTLKKTITEDGEAEYEIVEEIVYVDEDGNEVAKPKEPGFFGQFRDMLAKKDRSKRVVTPKASGGLNKKIKPKKLNLPASGPLPRFFGLAYNLIFFYVFLTMALPLVEDMTKVKSETYTEQGYQLVLPYLQKIPAQLPEPLKAIPEASTYYPQIRTQLLDKKNFHFLSLFLAYELIFNLLLGISLGPFLIGMKNGGNFLLTRILAPIRIVLGVILLPLFFIFDLPVLFRKKSFKELISFSRYEVRIASVTFFLAVILYPLLSLAGANFPVIMAAINEKGAMPTVGAIQEVAPTKPGKADLVIPVKSRMLGIFGQILLQPKIDFIPGIESSKATFSTKLTAFNNKKPQSAKIQRFENFLEVSKVTEPLKEDYLLTYMHPDLAAAIDKNSLIPKGQLMEALYTMISLDPKNPVEPILKYGIFLSPYFTGKEIIYQALGSSRIESVHRIKSPKNDFLQLSNGDTNGFKAIIMQKDKFLSMTKVSYEKKNHAFGNTIAEKIYYHNNEYTGDHKDLWTSQRKEEDKRAHAILVADILHRAVEDKEKISSDEANFIVKVFTQLCQKALDIEGTEFQEELLENFEQLDKALLKLHKRNKDEGLKELRLGLNRVQKALYKREYKFFKLNQ
ncbi:unnamed protein product, partial [Chrysoparadoxa australica]